MSLNDYNAEIPSASAAALTNLRSWASSGYDFGFYFMIPHSRWMDALPSSTAYVTIYKHLMTNLPGLSRSEFGRRVDYMEKLVDALRKEENHIAALRVRLIRAGMLSFFLHVALILAILVIGAAYHAPEALLVAILLAAVATYVVKLLRHLKSLRDRVENYPLVSEATLVPWIHNTSGNDTD